MFFSVLGENKSSSPIVPDLIALECYLTNANAIPLYIRCLMYLHQKYHYTCCVHIVLQNTFAGVGRFKDVKEGSTV